MNPHAESVPPLVVERVLNAPASLVWHALTSPEAISRWYFDMEGFRPEVGCEFRFLVEHQGIVFDHRCRVTEVVTERTLAYSWRYHGHGGDSHVTFELHPEGAKTRLRLTHAGLETFPKTLPLGLENFARGWNSLLGEELPDYVEHVDRELFLSREFQAPRELVWNAMTQPEHVVRWWGPRGFTSTIETMDFRVGGVWKFVMHGPDGTDYPNEHQFQEIVLHEKIVMSHGGGRAEAIQVRSRATWTFETIPGGKTRVKLRMVFPTAEHRDRVAREYGAVEGGKQTLMRLCEFVAAQRCQPLVISREFAAPRELVWKAWTEVERLQHWFGPRGLTSKHARLDFRPGGSFHYCQVTPDGREMWGLFQYREIVVPEKIVWVNCFSDSAGGITRHPFSDLDWPRQMLSEATFTERDGRTTVTLRWVPLDATDKEIEVFNSHRPSMTQGWTGTFEQLTQYLTTL